MWHDHYKLVGVRFILDKTIFPCMLLCLFYLTYYYQDADTYGNMLMLSLSWMIEWAKLDVFILAGRYNLIKAHRLRASRNSTCQTSRTNEQAILLFLSLLVEDFIEVRRVVATINEYSISTSCLFNEWLIWISMGVDLILICSNSFVSHVSNAICVATKIPIAIKP